MAADKELFEKADALLRRINAPAGGSDTGSVPVLTDLVDAPQDEPVEAAEAGAGAQVDVGELQQRIFTRVMAEVEGRLAAELERRLTEHLVPQVHAAVVSAMGDLHQELANTIGDAITEALKARQVK